MSLISSNVHTVFSNVIIMRVMGCALEQPKLLLADTLRLLISQYLGNNSRTCKHKTVHSLPANNSWLLNPGSYKL